MAQQARSIAALFRKASRGGTAALLLALSCENRVVPAADAGPSEPSPNASILPAPLAAGLELQRASARDGAPNDVEADAAPPVPEWSREDIPLPVDLDELHDPSGVTLAARFRWPDVSLPPRLPEVNADAVERSRAKATFDLNIELGASGRMRFALASKRFHLPEGTELRSRSDRLGHVLVWPNRARYAIVQAGTLRAVLNERRADTQPLTRADVVANGEGQAFGFRTERSRFATPFGRMDLEQARVTGAGVGGTLLCRLLLDLAGLAPETLACAAELVPVRAEYAWLGGGRLAFEVSNLTRATALDAESLRVPPREAEHRVGELPEPASLLLLERAELRGFRNKAVAKEEPREASAPKEGLLVQNGGDLLAYLLVDAVPVVRLKPRGSEVLLDLVPGSYSVSARDFLGGEMIPASLVGVPARIVVSEAPKSEP